MTPTFSGTSKYPDEEWTDSYPSPSEKQRTERETLSQSFSSNWHECWGETGSPSGEQPYVAPEDTSNTLQWSEDVDYDELSYNDALKGIDFSPDLMVTPFDFGNCFPGDQSYPLASGEEFSDIPLLKPNNSWISPRRQVQCTARKSRIHLSTSGIETIQEGNQLLLSENDSKCDRKSNLDWPSHHQTLLEHEQTAWPDSSPVTPPEPNPRVTSFKRKASPDDQEERLKSKTCTSSPSSLRKGHSVCEKRYRTKLNVKIRALRESIPHLHLLQKAPNKHDHDENEKLADRRRYLRDKNLAAPSDKATTISKAIEYISFLEMTNKRLTEEGRVLRSRVGRGEHPITAGSLVVRNGVIILKDCGLLGI
jgi:Helix-loop-helix DNA-binding domain